MGLPHWVDMGGHKVLCFSASDIRSWPGVRALPQCNEAGGGLSCVREFSQPKTAVAARAFVNRSTGSCVTEASCTLLHLPHEFLRMASHDCPHALGIITLLMLCGM